MGAIANPTGEAVEVGEEETALRELEFGNSLDAVKE